VNLAVIFGLYATFLLVIGHWPGWLVLASVPLLIVQALLALGLGLLLGTLHVFFRDVGQFVAVLLQFWFWLTPIVYPLHTSPDRFQPLLLMNPMQPIVAGYQSIFLHHAMPNWSALLAPIVAAMICVLGGAWLFLRHADELVDEL
jgi:lipopolysaccharide transport system permease protein